MAYVKLREIVPKNLRSDLREILGVSDQAWWSYLSGRRRPSPETAYEIVLFLRERGVDATLETILLPKSA